MIADFKADPIVLDYEHQGAIFSCKLHINMTGLGVLERVVQRLGNDPPYFLLEAVWQVEIVFNLLSRLDSNAPLDLVEAGLDRGLDASLVTGFTQLVEQQPHFAHRLQGGRFQVAQVGQQFALIPCVEGIVG